MGLDKPKIIRTLRLVFTCLILFLITWYYQLPEREWSLITVWFVMAEYSGVGGVLKKSFYRFSGTMLSALYGMVIIYFFANNVVINMLALVAGVFLYMYYFLDSEKMYIAVIGSVTLTIVLLNHNDLDAAILRTFNVMIGILGSMFMIRFFYPKYARDEVMEAQVALIKPISQILASYLDPTNSLAIIKNDYLKQEQIIVTNLAAFARHLGDAQIETQKTPLFLTYNKAAIEHIRHLFRLLSVFVNYVTTEEMRADSVVYEQLHSLLLEIQRIECRLEKAPLPDGRGSEPCLKSEQRLSDCTSNLIQSSEPRPSGSGALPQTIIHNMSQEIELLGIEVKKIIEIYETYET